MNGNPGVSVVLPFLNAEKFLQEAIESVLAQTYDSWELFLVDDGSNDSSTEIARRSAQRYPEKVRYLEHENHGNQGVCVSRNLGIRCSQGTYIALLDADDVWLPQKLEQQVAILDSQPEAGMVYGASQYWRSWTGIPADGQADDIPSLGVEADTLVRPPGLLTLYLESKARTPCPSDILLRRRVILEVGGFEENFGRVYQLYEDQAILAKICLSTPVFVASHCWDRYRQHSDSCSSLTKKAGQRDLARLFYLDWLKEYLSAHGINHPEVWRALRRKQWRFRHPELHRLLKPASSFVRQMKGLVNRKRRWDRCPAKQSGPLK